MSDLSVTWEANALDLRESLGAASLIELGHRPTRTRRKQSREWSLTMPTACIQA
jgi:hypothetical protein